jgi:biotin-(acetyl-CoA carboxylase) ligase
MLVTDTFAPLTLSYHWMTSSTLDLAPIEPLNTIIWADAQLSARGQYQRRWCSALGRQIQITFVLPLFFLSPLFPLYAMFRTLQPWISPVDRLTFKWPNDLYLNGSKIAGMLIHHFPDRCWISIGLNTTFYQDLPIITALWRYPHPISRVQLISQLITNLLSLPDHPENISEFLAKNHIIPIGSECKFSSSDEPLLFQCLLPSGEPLLMNFLGKIHDPKYGSFLIEQSFSFSSQRVDFE